MLIVLIISYVAGYAIAYAMLITEVKSEGSAITIGDRALSIFVALLSWLVVLQRMLMAWIEKISLTGYWDKPVVEPTDKTEAK